MTPPVKIGSGTTPPPPSPVEERKSLLSDGALVKDPRWGNSDFQQKHLGLYLLLESLRGYMKGSVTLQSLQKQINSIKSSAEYQIPENKKFYDEVFKNIHLQVRQFSSAENTARVQALQPILPKVEGVPDDSAKGKKNKGRFLGVELQNDTGPSWLFSQLGIPLDKVLNEQSIFTLKAPYEFRRKKHHWIVRPYGGLFKSKGIPGDEPGEMGTGYRVGLDMGLRNPYKKGMQAFGVGLEFTGFSSHAGEASGVEAPGPVFRMHLWKQDDLTFKAWGNLSLGVHSFFNYQETYWTLGNDDNFFSPESQTPLSVPSSLLVKSPLRLLGLTARWDLDGSSSKVGEVSDTAPLRPGEAEYKIGSVVVGSEINWNRRRDVPAFANVRVQMGTFEPLGTRASLEQFNLTGVGLTLFSLQDGWAMSGNAMDRAEIWRRGNWTQIGIMSAYDTLNLGRNLYFKLRTKPDAEGRSLDEFLTNPGYESDFDGRAGDLNLKLQVVELALTGLDAKGITRNPIGAGVEAAFGLALFFFPAPILGIPCDDEGVLGRCNLLGAKGKFFRDTPALAGPDDLRDVQNMYVIQTTGGAFAAHGSRRLSEYLFKKKYGTGKDNKVKMGPIESPYVQFQASGQGMMVMFGGRN